MQHRLRCPRPLPRGPSPLPPSPTFSFVLPPLQRIARLAEPGRGIPPPDPATLASPVMPGQAVHPPAGTLKMKEFAQGAGVSQLRALRRPADAQTVTAKTSTS